MSPVTSYDNFKFAKQGHDVGQEEEHGETTSRHSQIGEAKAARDENKDVGLQDVSSR